MSLLWWVPLGVLCLWGGVLAVFAWPLFARWREPVMRHPYLVLESDDWGAGPQEQAPVLKRLVTLLADIRDATGHPARMTLGVVLEVPDGVRIASKGVTRYFGLPLSDERFADIRTGMAEGEAAGVFVPQLHGQCHYWPDALLAAARDNNQVRDWLAAAGVARTEALPSPLQTRWVDASILPSRDLGAETIRQAVAAEVASYRAIFGQPPAVAVATTFVWNEAVEAAWSAAGIETVITPGRRATCRDGTGLPACVDRTMLTGEHAVSGLTYLVRDVYFEPALGHGPERLIEGLAQRTRQGRACLVEMHRFNFLDAADASLSALEKALQGALVRYPALRFIAPADLARAIRQNDPEWVETRRAARLAVWRVRIASIPRFARVARLSGLGWMLA